MAWTSTIVMSTRGDAQTLGAEGGLGTLLEQLQSLQSQGALGSVTGSGNGTLDAAREGIRRDLSGHLEAPSRLQKIREKELIRRIEAAKLAISNIYCQTGTVPEGSSSAEIEFLLSPIERDYCRRANKPLQQFGYNIFNADVRVDAQFSGAIQDDYILGIGDELVVTFHGQTQGTSSIRVNREGRVVIGELPPLPVAGLTFGEFRRNLEARVNTAMFGTEVFVSLGAVRAISVTVAGDVVLPGVKSLTSQTTIIDALTLAGGVKKTGSLRKIQVFRGDEVFWVDIYELILGNGLSHRLSLLDGDRVVVPSIGSTVAISGQVKRPGIFELSEGRTHAHLEKLLGLAGGPIRPTGNIYSHMAFETTGKMRINDYTNADIEIGEGEIIRVRYRQNVQTNTVQLLGHVRIQGPRSLSTTSTIHNLIEDTESLKDNPYLLFAILETTDPATHSRRLFPVNLQSILERKQDYALRDQDRLIVLGTEDIRYLMSNDVQQVLQFGRAVQDAEQLGAISRKTRQPTTSEDVAHPTGNPVQQVLLNLGLLNAPPSSDESDAENERQASEEPKPGRFACRGLQSLATIASTTRSGRFIQAVRATGLEGASPLVNPLPCPPIFDLFPGLLPFLLEHVVAVDGEVRRPGAYPMLDETPLSSVIAVSGGLTRNADLRNLELTRFATQAVSGTQSSVRKIVDVIEHGFENVLVNAGDVIRFNRAFTDRDSGPVLLSGEFVRPGLFDIRRGERLSEVIARAGGVTAQAFPYGAVFTRERVKRAQQAGFERAQRELTSAATFAAAKKGVDPSAVIALQQITRDLSSVEAVGRVVIEADPTVLQVKPEFDTVLEPGDKLFMPKRPNSVLVIGDVLNPGALQFISGQQADKYIHQAGGFQQSADQDRVFVVFPNGVAQPVSISVWNYNPAQVPPGSTIVAPKDPAPLDIFTFAKDIGALVSQLSITAASLAVIGDN